MRPHRLDAEEDILVDILSDLDDPEINDVHVSGRTVDVSAFGMKVSMNVSVPVNTHLGLRLDMDEEIYRLEGDVRWSKQGDRTFVGLEIDPNSPDFTKWVRLFSQMSSTSNVINLYDPAA